VGKETLVVLIGETRTVRVIIGVLGVLALSLLLGPPGGGGSSFSLVMLPLVLLYIWHLRACFKNRLKEDRIFEPLVEMVIVGVGVFALLWNLVSA
jgi:4-hydroxy-3-methylbut-2-enyl diphosphate reductase